MEIYTGIDIIEFEKFERVYKKYGEKFLKKVFHPEEVELLKKDILKLCISFSFKEAIWKALPEKEQKKFFLKDLKIIWRNNQPFLFLNYNTYCINLNFSFSKKYIITLAFLFRI